MIWVPPLPEQPRNTGTMDLTDSPPVSCIRFVFKRSTGRKPVDIPRGTMVPAAGSNFRLHNRQSGVNVRGSVHAVEYAYVRHQGGLLIQIALVYVQDVVDATEDEDRSDTEEYSPEWNTRPSSPATQHVVELNGKFGYVYEYASGKCWARIDDEKLGSFTSLETAKAAVLERLK